MSTPLEHARDLLRDGFAVVPVPYRAKGSVVEGWPDLRITDEELPKYFDGKPQNIGVLLGRPSGGRVDVDLDHEGAVALADQHLPATAAVWGRRGKPRSHRIFSPVGAMRSEQFQAVRMEMTPEGVEKRITKMIVEIRSDRLQSMAPGSVHPSGEPVRWDSRGEPARVESAHLRAGVVALANAAFEAAGLGAQGWTKSWEEPAPRSASATSNERAHSPIDRVFQALASRGISPKKAGKGWKCVCPAHSDTVPSLSIAEGDNGTVLLKCFAGCSIEAIAAALGLKVHELFPPKSASDARSASAAPSPWTAPRPLSEGQTAPPFPIESAFPEDLEDIREFVKAVAEQLQVPVDLPAMVLLPMVGVAIAQKLEIELRAGWREVAALWVLALLFSGERKSGTFSIMVSPILAWEKQETARLGPAIARAAELRKIAEARLERQRKIAAKAAPDTRQEETELALKLAEELEQMTVIRAPNIYTSDSTTEALATMLVENHERGLVASPEGDALDVMMGRYSERSTPNMGIWLKGHAGDAERVQRKSRRTEFLKRPVLSVAMVVQPEAVRGMFASRAARGRGLLGRFLTSAPASMLGRRKTGGAAKAIPERLFSWYQQVLRYLLDMPIDEDAGPAIVRLDGEATALFNAFEAKIETQLGRDGSLGDRSDWGGKLCGAAARIALVLYALRLASNGGSARCEGCAHLIDASIMRAALAWVPYLIDHERIVAGVVGCDRETSVADRILSWLRRTGLESFSRRDAFTATRSVLVQAVEDIDGSLDLLEELGYIRQEPSTAPSRLGGRRPSARYSVNPIWNRGGAS